ncbi:MAG: ABC transporter substrate-binding protein [Chloroflexota bacterium]|nr:ABC transporter substrate-binding protein [Chloroflexota bacterium]
MRMSRRQALAGLGAVAVLRLAGGAALAQDATPGGEWTFTDDAGKTVTLPAAPRRIVADLNAATALWDFGIRPEAVSGWTVATDAAWGNLDRATPNITANAGAPDPNVEKLLEIKPDLFVTVTWGPQEESGEPPYAWSFTDDESYQRVNEIVPVIGISAAGLADRNLARYAELAALLGADLETPELQAAQAAYDERVARFAGIAQEKADLTTLFASANGEAVYVANPADWADLAWYRTLGLTILDPEAARWAYWEELSAEQAGKYQPDILFESAREGSFTKEELQAHPLYRTLPAVAAGQVASWNQDFIQSYQGLGAALETMIAALESAQKVTG